MHVPFLCPCLFVCCSVHYVHYAQESWATVVRHCAHTKEPKESMPSVTGSCSLFVGSSSVRLEKLLGGFFHLGKCPLCIKYLREISGKMDVVHTLFQLEGGQVGFEGTIRQVHFHAYDERRACSGEVDDWNPGPGYFLRLFVDVHSLGYLLFVHVAECQHLSAVLCIQAAVESSALLASIPDGKAGPVDQNGPTESLHAHVPNGGLRDGEGGLLRVVAVGEEVAVHSNHPSTEVEVPVEEDQVLWNSLATFVEASNSLKYLPAAKPGGHYDGRSMRRKDLHFQLLVAQEVRPGAVSFCGTFRKPMKPGPYYRIWRAPSGSLILLSNPIWVHDVVNVQKAEVFPTALANSSILGKPHSFRWVRRATRGNAHSNSVCFEFRFPGLQKLRTSIGAGVVVEREFQGLAEILREYRVEALVDPALSVVQRSDDRHCCYCCRL
uniref:Secreted protein n=1 Tax=Ixodes ricinus TaxID=34613 RepID=A0A147BEN9_IXORI